jgi:H+-transporting ATPase
MIILNETIRSELIVFIAIFADVATVSYRSYRFHLGLTDTECVPRLPSLMTAHLTHIDQLNGSCRRFGLSLLSLVSLGSREVPKSIVLNLYLSGLMLAGATWIIRGTMFVKSGGVIQNFGSYQEVLFLEVSLTESALFSFRPM